MFSNVRTMGNDDQSWDCPCSSLREPTMGVDGTRGRAIPVVCSWAIDTTMWCYARRMGGRIKFTNCGEENMDNYMYIAASSIWHSMGVPDEPPACVLLIWPCWLPSLKPKHFVHQYLTISLELSSSKMPCQLKFHMASRLKSHHPPNDRTTP